MCGKKENEAKRKSEKYIYVNAVYRNESFTSNESYTKILRSIYFTY